jgi:phage terminase large subunit-like protein
MPRTCTICRNDECHAIDTALVAGEALRTIADRWSVPKTALIRHRDHIPRTLAKAHEAGEAAQDADPVPDLTRIVVGVDPALSATEGSAETGIVVAGVTRAEYGQPALDYVLADAPLRGSPREWAEAVVEAYRAHNADRIIAEANAAGDMVEAVIRTMDPVVPIELIHASRGKYTRAEPVAALYEQELVHHAGEFRGLEDQMTTFVPGEPSPDRLDTLVHAITALMEAPPMPVAVRVLARPTPFY